MNKKSMIITGLIAYVVFTFVFYDKTGWSTALIQAALATALVLLVIGFLVVIYRKKRK